MHRAHSSVPSALELYTIFWFSLFKYFSILQYIRPIINDGFKKAVNYAFDFVNNMPRIDKAQKIMDKFR